MPETASTVPAGIPGTARESTWTTEVELNALPVLAVILNPDGNPHAYQKRVVFIGGQRLARWFCTTDTDWPESSARLLRENREFVTLWSPQGGE